MSDGPMCLCGHSARAHGDAIAGDASMCLAGDDGPYGVQPCTCRKFRKAPGQGQEPTGAKAEQIISAPEEALGRIAGVVSRNTFNKARTAAFADLATIAAAISTRWKPVSEWRDTEENVGQVFVYQSESESFGVDWYDEIPDREWTHFLLPTPPAPEASASTGSKAGTSKPAPEVGVPTGAVERERLAKMVDRRASAVEGWALGADTHQAWAEVRDWQAVARIVREREADVFALLDDDATFCEHERANRILSDDYLEGRLGLGRWLRAKLDPASVPDPVNLTDGGPRP